MANFIIDSICDTSSSSSSGSNITSSFTYDGSDLVCIGFVGGTLLNNNFSSLNAIICGLRTDTDTNTSNVSANSGAILANTTLINTNTANILALAIPDVNYNHGTDPLGTGLTIDFSTESTLDGVLEQIVAWIDTASGLDTSLLSKYTDVDYYVNEFVISGLAITGTATVPTVDIAAGVVMNTGKEINVSSSTVGLTANRDNYIDIKLDGTYIVRTVAISGVPSALASGNQNVYMLTVDSGGNVTATSDNRVMYPFDGSQIAPNTVNNDRLLDSGVTAATYGLIDSVIVNSKGIITSITEVTSVTSKYVRFNGANYVMDGVIFDNGSKIGLNTTTPSTIITLGPGEAYSTLVEITTGVTATQTGAGPVTAATYYFVVAPITSIGVGLPSAEASEVVAGTALKIDVAWTKTPGAIGYRIYRGTVTGVYTDYADVNESTFTYPYDGTGLTAGVPATTNTALSMSLAPGLSYLGGDLSIGSDLIDSSAILELTSTLKGFLGARMTTTQRNAIAGPATGLEIYNTTTNLLEFYNGTSWVSVSTGVDNNGIYTGSGSLSIPTTITMGTNDLGFDSAGLSNLLYFDNTNDRIGIGTNTPSGTLTVSISQNSTTRIQAINSNTGSSAIALLGVTNDSNNSFTIASFGTATASSGSLTTDIDTGNFLKDSINIFTSGTLTSNINIGTRGATGQEISFFTGSPAFNTANRAMIIKSNQDIQIPNGDAIIGGTTINGAAALQIDSTTGGVLIPRMTAVQGSALTGVNGLIIYATSTNGTFTSVGVWAYEAGTWIKL